MNPCIIAIVKILKSHFFIRPGEDSFEMDNERGYHFMIIKSSPTKAVNKTTKTSEVWLGQLVVLPPNSLKLRM
jgi:hypothetical protein